MAKRVRAFHPLFITHFSLCSSRSSLRFPHHITLLFSSSRAFATFPAVFSSQILTGVDLLSPEFSRSFNRGCVFPTTGSRMLREGGGKRKSQIFELFSKFTPNSVKFSHTNENSDFSSRLARMCINVSGLRYGGRNSLQSYIATPRLIRPSQNLSAKIRNMYILLAAKRCFRSLYSLLLYAGEAAANRLLRR